MGRKDVVEQFEQQVETFAVSDHATHEDSLKALHNMLGVDKDMKVLDVCCGPGLVACSIAPHVAQVVGVDLTPGMVAKGESRAKELGLDNASFKVADALSLPFDDGEFDAVSSRFAMHQIPRPHAALVEQARVAKPGGIVVTFDSLTSEDRLEADFHNEVARLREPEHARSLSLTELINYFHAADMDVERYQALNFTISSETWIQQAHAPEASRAQARKMFREAVGTRKFGGRRVFEEDGEVHYVARWGIVVGRKRS